MMEPAFLAEVALSPRRPSRPFAPLAGFETLVETPELRLLVTTNMPRRTFGSSAILGRLYSRRAMAPAVTLMPDAWRAIAESRGQALIDDFWGDYVAFLSPLEGISPSWQILRAPLGQLGCYWHGNETDVAVVSHPDLLIHIGTLVPRIDFATLARHIAGPELAHRRTCLANVHALTGGDRLAATLPHPRVDSLWSPWKFCADTPAVKSLDAASSLLRDVLIASVAAQTAEHSNLILLLSGGLDSSLLAACLRLADRPFHALTLVTQAANGDERSFARMAADATDARLSEVFRTANGVDLGRSRAARGARPYARAFIQESERIADEIAQKEGASAIVDGGGGDNLFFNYTSLAALVEILRTHGPGRRFWRTTAAFADLTGNSLASVALRTVRRALIRDNRLRFPARHNFLAPAALAAVTAAPPHPWHDPPISSGTGKAAHVALLASAQSSAEQGPNFCGTRPWFSPFICQPVVETVLRLPIWSWFAPGHNRAAARLAFRNDLPAVLIDRRSKGTPGTFVWEQFEMHRHQIRDMLLDGQLAAFGLLDTEALSKVLDDPAPARDFQYARIMELVDAEAWVRSWG